jgi:hypothetical protein
MFTTIFQGRVRYENPLTELPLDELETAARESCTAQEPVKDSRVKSIADSILKDMQLWQPIKVVYITDTHETLTFGGRHRTAAIRHICTNYVISPTGDVVARSAATTDCEEIEPVVGVIYATVDTRADASHLLTSDNSSRSMTPAERLFTEEFAGTLSALAALKLRMTRSISGAKVHTSSGETIAMTTQAVKTIVTKLIKELGQKKALSMTDVQIDILCNEFANFVEDKNNSQSWDLNFSREGHKQAVADFLNVPALDDDGEILIVEVEDEDGDVTEHEVSWFNNFAASVTVAKAPKKSKKAAKAEEAEALIASLRQELEALKASR